MFLNLFLLQHVFCLWMIVLHSNSWRYLFCGYPERMSSFSGRLHSLSLLPELKVSAVQQDWGIQFSIIYRNRNAAKPTHLKAFSYLVCLVELNWIGVSFTPQQDFLRKICILLSYSNADKNIRSEKILLKKVPSVLSQTWICVIQPQARLCKPGLKIYSNIHVLYANGESDWKIPF